MRIVVFGANGQVGRECQARVGAREIIAAARIDADLSRPGAAARLIADAKPDCIINAAAYTNVDGAESQCDIAQRINADAAGEIAAAAAAINASLVHISTDYVFNGEGAAPLTEEAEPAPLNAYGKSKCDGEARTLAAHPQAIILRTSWVYSAHGKNFVKTMLNLAQTRDALSIVHDQIGGPTPAGAIAEAAFTIADSLANGAVHKGIYHFQGAPAVSWAEFAEAIFTAAGIDMAVEKIPSSAYPTPAKRPLYTVLDCSRILHDFSVDQPDWRTDIATLAPQLTGKTA